MGDPVEPEPILTKSDVDTVGCHPSNKSKRGHREGDPLPRGYPSRPLALRIAPGIDSVSDIHVGFERAQRARTTGKRGVCVQVGERFMPIVHDDLYRRAHL